MNTDLVQVSTIQVQQATSDEQVLKIWLHGKSFGTIRAYSLDVGRFMDFVQKSISQVTVGDVQNWMDSLDCSPNRKNRAVMAIKSLFSFASKIGYIHFNVAAVVRAEKLKEVIAERIVSEAKIHEIMALEIDKRNKLILKTLYYSGIRVSELTILEWKDLRDGVLTVFGKGGKTRFVRLPDVLADELEGLRLEDGFIFQNRYGNSLSTVSIWKLVKVAGKRVGAANFSPHFFRHAHASHSLDRGAPANLVKDTLGHASLVTTSKYSHSKPNSSSGSYLA
jgi:integrase/recombinase XerD